MKGKKRSNTMRGKERSKVPGEHEHILKRLPPQIMGDILSRVSSIKTLIHCKCVCKSWNQLISDPYYIHMHVARSIASLLISSYSGEKRLIEVEKDLTLMKNSQLNQSERLITTSRRLIGSCNGLICLEEAGSDACYIVNPVLGSNDFVMLPDSSIESSKYSIRQYMNTVNISGFGFCPRTNQYKVIRSLKYGDAVYIYTLGTHSWRRINDEDIPKCKYGSLSPGLPLNGALHWLPDYPIDDKPPSVEMSCFDINTEKFHQLPLPTRLRGMNLRNLKLGVLGNCLAVYHSPEHLHLETWVMKDYGAEESWANIFSFNGNDHNLNRRSIILPLKLTKDGDLLIYVDRPRSILCFDLRSRNLIEEKKIHGLKRSADEGRCIAFVASLISPKEIMKTTDEVIASNS